ncbi:hypothetical protein [Massilia brevitalea]|uniref:hypothetical protein n=1 Tax=Massilia brevitalea TaxID=442526 RepID=UPI002738DBC2|nr:hypothetical protein [Massilia brevitalea]
MPWKYLYPNTVAIETETNTKFDVKIGRSPSTMDDVELTPSGSAKQKFDAVSLTKFRAGFWEIFQKERRRSAMRNLVDNKFGGDTLQASIAIQNITKKPVSHRTIQAWLMEPGARSSRFCPEWALVALKAFVDAPENIDYLASCERISAGTSSYMPYSSAVDVRYGVKYATDAIANDEKRQREWSETSLTSLPHMISQFENKTERHFEHLDMHAHAMWRALREATDFEDFRRRVLDEVKDKEIGDTIVRKTRRAIEQGTDEFANDREFTE